MNLWQIVIAVIVFASVATLFAFIALVIVTVYKEQQYKLQAKYAPKNDKELEERMTALLLEVLDAREQRRKEERSDDV